MFSYSKNPWYRYLISNNMFDSKLFITINIANDYEAKVVARIDHLTGKTVWAKAMVLQYKSYLLEVVNADIADDFFWVRIYCFRCWFQIWSTYQLLDFSIIYIDFDELRRVYTVRSKWQHDSRQNIFSWV